MAKIHMTVQGKGGVGKSVIASVIAQYKQQLGQNPSCVCLDPVNATFTGYKALGAKHLQIMENEDINKRKFDELIELIAESKDDVVIDTGSTSFISLTHYIISNQIPALLTEMGHELVIHTVITGGQALLDTVNGFAQLASQLPTNTCFVVWLNPFWGPVEYEGKSFEQLKAYATNKAKVSAIINIPTLKAELHGRDFADMLKERLTFDEAIAMESRTIMTRQRLKQVKTQLFEQLDNARVL